jgi:hypothetical protein
MTITILALIATPAAVETGEAMREAGMLAEEMGVAVANRKRSLLLCAARGTESRSQT